MHKEVVPSSWLMQDVEGMAEEMERVSREAKEGDSNSGNREVEGKGKGSR